ncbi:hypothetical protein MAR_021394, partial [Mya arenaria]
SSTLSYFGKTIFYKWHEPFRNGRQSIKDDNWTVRPNQSKHTLGALFVKRSRNGTTFGLFSHNHNRRDVALLRLGKQSTVLRLENTQNTHTS